MSQANVELVRAIYAEGCSTVIWPRWTLRDGKVERFEWGRDLGAALEAARARE
jgi:hypothetical protein